MTPIVLIHGAYHGGWCWQYVAQRLREAGAEVHCPDLPGHGDSTAPLSDLYGDAQSVRELIESLGKPPILCGHSYGGMVITEAVNRPELVTHMVYLAALVPNAGKPMGDDMPDMANAAINEGIIINDDGLASFNPDMAEHYFYADCSPEDIAWAIDHLDEQKMDTFIQTVNQSLWNVVDSTYILCSEDRAAPFEVQQLFASRCRHSVTIEASHSPMISQPDTIVRLLLDIAKK